MDYIKLFVNNAFRKGDFVEEMRGMNIAAAPATDGIIIDREAFNNAIEAGVMTAWGKAIEKDINNPLKTRTAELNEWPTRKLYHYMVCIVGDEQTTELIQTDSLEDAIRYANDAETILTDRIFVVDTTTGEVMN